MLLLDAWRHLDGSSPGWTWDTRNPHVLAHGFPSARIDYILTGPPWIPDAGRRGAVEGVGVVGNMPVNGVWPSDHSAVVADLAE